MAQPDYTRNLPNEVKITISVSAKHSKNYKEATIEIPFTSQLKIISQSKRIQFYEDDRTQSIEVFGNTNIQVQVLGDSSILQHSIRNHQSIESHYYIDFSIPQTVQHDFEDLEVRINELSSLVESTETVFVSYKNTPKKYTPTKDIQRHEEKPVRTNKPTDNGNSEVDTQEVTSFIYIIVIFLVVLVIFSYLFFFKNDEDSNLIEIDQQGYNLSSGKRRQLGMRESYHRDDRIFRR